jgi:hypothetical protein
VTPRDANAEVMNVLVAADEPTDAVVDALQACAVFQIQELGLDDEADWKVACGLAWMRARKQVERTEEP